MNRVKELREFRGLSIRAVSRSTEISHPTLLRIEKGERKISASNAIKLAKFFGVSIDYLLGVSDEPTPAESAAGWTDKKQISISPIESEMLDLFREIGKRLGESTQQAAIAMLQNVLNLSGKV